MPYRPTKEKFAVREKAHTLYVEDRLPLEEISRQTGEPIRTLKLWRDLGDWESMREENAKSEFERLRSLRDSLIDRAEAQLKEGKLPHTEIGLVTKLERTLAQSERRIQKMAPAMVMYTLEHLVHYLLEHDPELAKAFADHIEQFTKWAIDQDLTRPPEKE